MNNAKNKVKITHSIKAIIFDLGNTLYDKEQYIKLAFSNVADYLKKTMKLDKKMTVELLNRIWKVRTSHYEFIFKDFLDVFGIYSATRLQEVLDIYHNTKGRLASYPGVPQLFTYLKKHYKIGLVTDGNPVMQLEKIKMLGWEKPGKPFDVIIYTANYGKSYLKPNPFAYQLAAEKLGISPKETLYVGDNPHDDFIGAKETRIFTVRVLQGEFKNLRLDDSHEADITINRISDLKNLL